MFDYLALIWGQQRTRKEAAQEPMQPTLDDLVAAYRSRSKGA